MNIQVADYKLFPYEEDLLQNEISTIGGNLQGNISRGAILEIGDIPLKKALLITFIKGVIYRNRYYYSKQHLRESVNGSKRIQGRRYGPHGLHEYKGRFNPQIPRSLILSNFIPERSTIILDPFMGSGTTLIESRGLGFNSIGVELNPFAHFLTKAKIFFEELKTIPQINSGKLEKDIRYFRPEVKEYLNKWFPEQQLKDLEAIMARTENYPKAEKLVLRTLLSNLLREHSYQNPKDLRIRRRAEVPDGLRLMQSFQKNVWEVRQKHEKWIKLFGRRRGKVSTILGDSRELATLLTQKVDGTVSSPPYASALPYIDTYRLSMVALGLISSKDIFITERELIGARDITQQDMIEQMKLLKHAPDKIKRIINHILNETRRDSKAGFRKKAVPYTLVKYISSMKNVLENLYLVEKSEAKNLWVVGPNKIRLASGLYYINTPVIIGELASAAGFSNIEIRPIQAYPRYNIHSKNSITKESIVIFKKL